MNCKLFCLLLLCLMAFYNLSAQDTIDLETFDLPADTFINQSNGQFISKNISLPNSYDPTYATWTGWSISTMRDTITPGYTNQYSCIAGSGAEASKHYAMAYCYDGCTIRLYDTLGIGTSIEGFKVNNATYTYLSMRDGDAFSKRFGGETGTDPDFLRLTIRGFRDGRLSSDSINFYLADYRFDDAESDYLVKDWSYVDITSLGEADSVFITMTSSDVGIYGINTPTYFAIDDIVVTSPVSARTRVQAEILNLFPNPAGDWITIQVKEEGDQPIRIFDRMGRSYPVDKSTGTTGTIDVSMFPAGIYWVQYDLPKGKRIGRFVKM